MVQQKNNDVVLKLEGVMFYTTSLLNLISKRKCNLMVNFLKLSSNEKIFLFFIFILIFNF